MVSSSSSDERSLNVSSCSLTRNKVGGGAKYILFLLHKVSYTYSTMMKLGTIIPSLKKIEKNVERGFVRAICSDHLQIVFLRYFSKTVFEVIFGGRNTSSTAFKPSILEWTIQLSTMIANFRLSPSNLLSSHPIFCLCSIMTRKVIEIFESYRFQHLFCRSTCNCQSCQPDFALFTTVIFVIFTCRIFLKRLR